MHQSKTNNHGFIIFESLSKKKVQKDWAYQKLENVNH